jgi:deazaflavin-dependent oxidoreductase (nitroreductase family)
MARTNRSLRDRFVDGVRVFNKYIFNRFTLFLARRGIGPFSVIVHTGRRSGRTYQTPVMASHMGETVVIPLTYGTHVDWLQNILAQGGCEIIFKKRSLKAMEPEVIDGETAARNLPASRSDLFHRFDIDRFLRVRVEA